MDKLDKLQELLTKLPGIGPRQARRFAFYLLQVNQDYINTLVDVLNELRGTSCRCSKCNRIFFLKHNHTDRSVCQTCADETRDLSRILLVAKQADFENIERSGVWDGNYFVLGRLTKMSDKNPGNDLPMALWHQRLSEFDAQELVIGLPINPEGGYTKDIILDNLQDLFSTTKMTVSELARGLSVGSELEYSDPLTIEEALKNRR